MENQSVSSDNIQADQTPLSPVSEPPRQNYWKFVAIIAVVLLFGMGAVVGYLLQGKTQPQPQVSNIMPTIPLPTSGLIVDETATWKTYTNTQFDYSISYPSMWKAYNVVAGGGSTSEALASSLIVDISDTTQASRPYPNGVITIQGLDAAPSFGSPWIKTNKTINGINATVYEYSGEAYDANTQDGPSIIYIFDNSKGKYIEVVFRSSKEDSIRKTFDQILSTFKLISNNSTDVSFSNLPANWTQNGSIAKSTKACYQISGKKIGQVVSIKEYLAKEFNLTVNDVDQLITNTAQVQFQGVEAITIPSQNLGEVKRVYVRPGDVFWYEILTEWIGAGEGTTQSSNCSQEEKDLDLIIRSVAFH